MSQTRNPCLVLSCVLNFNLNLKLGILSRISFILYLKNAMQLKLLSAQSVDRNVLKLKCYYLTRVSRIECMQWVLGNCKWEMMSATSLGDKEKCECHSLNLLSFRFHNFYHLIHRNKDCRSPLEYMLSFFSSLVLLSLSCFPVINNVIERACH